MAPKTFRWIRSGPMRGAANMALDEALASSAPPVPTVRVYRWDPWTLSLGCFQRVEERDLEPFRDAGFDVTRRSTGGGAILHADEITYSVVLPIDDPRIPTPVAASYDWLHGAVREALAEIGVPTESRGAAAEGPEPFFCFARTAAIDLVAGGRKVVGSAQRRTRSAFLQHGSIPLSPNGSARASSSLSELRGGPVDPAALEEALGRAFARVLGAEAVPGAPTEAEEAAARTLVEGKYGHPDWVLRDGGRPARLEPPADLPPPTRVLRAAVADGTLRVLAAVGGARPVLPLADLRAVDGALVRGTEMRASPGERDPWDSTFRRSLLGGREAESGAAAVVDVEDSILLLRFGPPDSLLHIDLRRFNYADLGPRATGDWKRDGRTLLAGILAAAPPGAARGPGAGSMLLGGPLPPLPGPETLLGRVRLLGS